MNDRINGACVLATAAAWALTIGCTKSGGPEPTSDEIVGVKPIYQFSISPGSRLMATIGIQPAIQIRDLTTHRTLRTLKHNNQEPVAISFRSTDDALLAVYRNGSVVLWNDVAGEKPRPREYAILSGDGVFVCCIHGERIAAVDRHGILSVWNRGSRVGRWVPTNGDRISHLGFSRDGKRLLSCGDLSGVRVWNSDTGSSKCLVETNGLSIRSACFSPDGRRIATAGFYGELREWSVDSGLQLWSLNLCRNALTALRYAPDGKSLIAGTIDGDVVLCQAAMPRAKHVIARHADSVSQLWIALDGVLHVSSQRGEVLSVRLDDAIKRALKRSTIPATD